MKIRILTLPEDIQEVIVSNRLTERHARALLKLQNESDRRRVIERVVHNHLNVKQTEKLIDDILLSRSAPPKGCGKINYINYKIYLNTLKKAFNQVKTLEKDPQNLHKAIWENSSKLKSLFRKADRCFT